MPVKLKPEEALRRPIKIFLSDDERSSIESKAHSSGLALSSFIRRVALGAKVSTIPQPNAEKWQDLARLAGNLNQLARAANSYAAVEVDSTLLMEVAVLVRSLRQDLIGLEGEE